MFAFLLIVQTLIAVSLIGIILMQRSEGGGLGVGGSSSGFMTARGAADFLTRSTAVLGGAVHRPFDRHGRDCRRDPPAARRSTPRSPNAPLRSTQPQAAPQQQQPTAPATNPQQNQHAPAVPLAQ